MIDSNDAVSILGKPIRLGKFGPLYQTMNGFESAQAGRVFGAEDDFLFGGSTSGSIGQLGWTLDSVGTPIVDVTAYLGSVAAGVVGLTTGGTNGNTARLTPFGASGGYFRPWHWSAGTGITFDSVFGFFHYAESGSLIRVGWMGGGTNGVYYEKSTSNLWSPIVGSSSAGDSVAANSEMTWIRVRKFNLTPGSYEGPVGLTMASSLQNLWSATELVVESGQPSDYLRPTFYVERVTAGATLMVDYCGFVINGISR